MIEFNQTDEVVVYERELPPNGRSSMDTMDIDYVVRIGYRLPKCYQNGRDIFRTTFRENGHLFLGVAESEAIVVSKAVYRFIETMKRLGIDFTVVPIDFTQYFRQVDYINCSLDKRVDEWIDNLYQHLLRNAKHSSFHQEWEVIQLLDRF